MATTCVVVDVDVVAPVVVVPVVPVVPLPAVLAGLAVWLVVPVARLSEELSEMPSAGLPEGVPN